MHQQYGDPRQDDHALSEDGRYLVLAVADGVSSGPWSHHAAQIVTQAGSAHVAELRAVTEPSSIVWGDVLAELADQIHRRCAELRGEVDQGLDLHAAVPPEAVLDVHEVAKQMATTIVYAVVSTTPGEDGTHAATVVRHGDAAAWLLDGESGWQALGDVKNAGNVIAESATACLPFLPQQEPVPTETTVGPGQALLLLTDGVGDPLGSGQGEVGAQLARLWANPPQVFDFTAQISFGRKTFDDDRGAIGVWPIG